MSDSRHLLFRLVIHEALRRGAHSEDISLLRTKYLFWSGKTPQVVGVGDIGFNQTLLGLEEDWADLAIQQETSEFEALIQGEMDRITYDDGRCPVADQDQYRYKVRPLYYSHGYTDPAAFLEKQEQYALFGNANLKTWMHEDLRKVLEKVEPILTRWKVLDTSAKEVKGVNGLQIRTIAGSSSLSNHAFGLAIDVNAYSNPHVVGWEVIEVFNWAAQRVGVHFDFGKTILSRTERGHAEYTVDDVLEMHNRLRPASDAVRSWLQAHMPQYRRLMAEVRDAEKVLGVKHVASNTPLDERARKAAAAWDAVKRKQELKNASKASGPEPALGSDSSESVAYRTITANLGRIAESEHLRRIQVLYEHFEDTKYIDTWEKQGIMTMPLYLAAVLVGQLKLRWGEQYESSKDAMHFELMDTHGKSYIKPESPLSGEKPRTLRRLIDETFGPTVPNFHLLPPALLQKAHCKKWT
jgi:hypothetical protein